MDGNLIEAHVPLGAGKVEVESSRENIKLLQKVKRESISVKRYQTANVSVAIDIKAWRSH